MAWVFLVCAGLLEIVFALCLKYSQGFTRLWPSVGFIVAGIASFQLLSQALRTRPVGTAYAVWTGIGAALTAILGMVLFHEPRDLPRLVCLLLIVTGVVGLKLVSPSH